MKNFTLLLSDLKKTKRVNKKILIKIFLKRKRKININ